MNKQQVQTVENKYQASEAEIQAIRSYVNIASEEVSSLINNLQRSDIEQLEDSNITNNDSCKIDDERIAWIRIEQVGLVAGQKVEPYFQAMKNILQAFHLPHTEMLFMIHADNGFYKMYLGLRGDESTSQTAVSEHLKGIRDFISASWRGTICSKVKKKTESDIKQLRFENVYAITGIPSIDVKKDYPATLAQLMDGVSSGSLIYLVIASPLSTTDINRIIDVQKDYQGKMESIKQSSYSLSGRSGWNSQDTEHETDQETVARFNTLGLSVGVPFVGGGLNYGRSKNEGHSSTHGISSGISKDFSMSLGGTISNAHATRALDYLSLLGKRLEEGRAIGMWQVGCYLFTDHLSKSSVHQLKSLLSGERSSMEPMRSTDISRCCRENNNDDGTKEVVFFNRTPNISFLKGEKRYLNPFGEYYSDLRTCLSSTELAYMINFPLHSVTGITVREIAAFGRDAKQLGDHGVGGALSKEKRQDELCDIGRIVHLGERQNNTVKLPWDSISSHVFIAGSTGSGKSTLVYYLLKQLRAKNKKFLVIEPAKGEYKRIFGQYDDVTVLGTAPNQGLLLGLNPFYVPQGITLEEHVDRLVDIFITCWPMYAAMPAVLKESIYRAYSNCGWGTRSSISQQVVRCLPTFKDVLEALEDYINNGTVFSADTKGDYIGALATRLQSLCNGTLGQIFSNASLDDEELFNERNVIIDLSRIGSSETRSLIIGIILMKQIEFRLSEGVMDSPLRHVTVLEEAHNLLRKTSFNQSQDSSNMVGKSVEMLAGAIAEMRTYGEGFIIADQSPSILDKSVITNTNTKILFNLPERDDRIVAGDAIGLTEIQKTELAKIKTGTAVVFQKGWEEACLVEIDPSNVIVPQKYEAREVDNPSVEKLLYKILSDLYLGHIGMEFNCNIASLLVMSQLSGREKCSIISKLKNPDFMRTDAAWVFYKLYTGISGQNIAHIYHLGATLMGTALSKLFNDDPSLDKNKTDLFVEMYIRGYGIEINDDGIYDLWLSLNLNKHE